MLLCTHVITTKKKQKDTKNIDDACSLNPDKTADFSPAMRAIATLALLKYPKSFVEEQNKKKNQQTACSYLLTQLVCDTLNNANERSHMAEASF